MKYEPNSKSLENHKVPDWFHNAKLGIFIHWGLYSVPAFAPTEQGSINEVLKKSGWKGHYKNNPYAEWYLNSMKIEGSPTRKYHIEKYGEDFPYTNFIPEFNKAIENWDPNKMADLFKKVGARYVVLGTKHHDGFLLWPSKYPNPKKKNYCASRNIVGELTKAVKERGMRMGFYYSGGLDWTFNETPIQNFSDVITIGPMELEYIDYINHHFEELINEYKPSVLWNDISYPPNINVYKLFAYYYDKIPDGVINDRWMQVGKRARKILKSGPINALASWIGKRMFVKGTATMPGSTHCDFKTPEYGSFGKIKKYKWESTRGIGYSFGYNQKEGEKEYISVEALIRMFVDIVSKNGNLLLNVGPMADGTIPDMQIKRLLGLGKWLEIYGEAIFNTQPWLRAESRTEDNIGVRFTQKKDVLYLILLDTPKKERIIIKTLVLKNNSIVNLLGSSINLDWKQEKNDLTINLSEKIPEAPAHAFKISPKP